MPLFSVRKQIKSWSLDHNRRSVVESSDKGNNHNSKATIKQNKMTPGRSQCALKPQDVRYSSLTKTTYERHNEGTISDDQPNRIVESVYVEKHERPRLSRARSLNRSATLKGNSTPQPKPDIQHRPVYRKKIFRIFSKEHPQKNLEEKKEIPHYYQKRTLSETRKAVTMEVDISPVRCVNEVIAALKANVDTLRFTVVSLDDSLMENGLKNCFQISTHFTNKMANDKPVYDEKVCPLGQQEKHSVLGKSLASDLDRNFDLPETSVDSGKFVRMRNHPMNGQLDKQQTTCQFSTGAIRSVHRIYTCQSSAERDYWLNKFRFVTSPDLFSRRRRENSLHLCLQELKGVPEDEQYFCEIYLDSVLYARTTVKTMKEMLVWGEEFDFSLLPDITDVNILLWLVKAATTAEEECAVVSFSERSLRRASLTRAGDLEGANHRFQSQQFELDTHRISITQADSWASVLMDTSCSSLDAMQQYASKSQSKQNDTSLVSSSSGDSRHRRKGRFGASRSKKKLTRFCLLAKFVIPTRNINNLTDTEAWYSCEASNHGSNGNLFPEGANRDCESYSSPTSGVKRLSLKSGRLKWVSQKARLRIKACYSSLTVLPVCGYSPLQECLSVLETPLADSTRTQRDLSPRRRGQVGENRTNCIDLLRHLEPWLSAKSKATLAQSLLAMHKLRRQVPVFLSSLVLAEVRQQDNPNMVLRSNSLATKAIELYLRQTGGPYLHAALDEVVGTILASTKTSATSTDVVAPMCEKRGSLGRRTSASPLPSSHAFVPGKESDLVDFEVDPTRVTNSSQLLRNQSNLLRIVYQVWQKIQGTISVFPLELRRTFYAIRRSMVPPASAGGSGQSGRHFSRFSSTDSERQIQGAKELFEHVISACVFLRFVCPAILSPSLFGLTDRFPEDTRVVRAFTLVAKAIQNLANFTLFGDSKEIHMSFLNRFVAEQLPAMRTFLWRISDFPCNSEVEQSSSVPSYSARLVDLFVVSESQTSRCAGGTHRRSTLAVNPKLQTSTLPHQDTLFPVDRLNGGASSDLDDILFSKRGCSDLDDSLFKMRDVIKTSISSGLSETRSLDLEDYAVVDCGGSLWSPALRGVPDLLSDVSVCRRAICTISSLLLAKGDAPALDQLNLAICLARCHLQLTSALERVPAERLNSPLRALWDILTKTTALLSTDSDLEWGVNETPVSSPVSSPATRISEPPAPPKSPTLAPDVFPAPVSVIDDPAVAASSTSSAPSAPYPPTTTVVAVALTMPPAEQRNASHDGDLRRRAEAATETTPPAEQQYRKEVMPTVAVRTNSVTLNTVLTANSDLVATRRKPLPPDPANTGLTPAFHAASEPTSLAGLESRPNRKDEGKSRADAATRHGSFTSKQAIEESSWSLLNSLVSGSDASHSRVTSATPAPSLDLHSSTDDSINFSQGSALPLSDLLTNPFDSVAAPSSRQFSRKIMGGSMRSGGSSKSPISVSGSISPPITENVCPSAPSTFSTPVQNSPSYLTGQSSCRAAPRSNKSTTEHQSEIPLTSSAVFNPLYSCYHEQRPKLISVHTQTVGWATTMEDYPAIASPSYPVTVLDEEEALGRGGDSGGLFKPQLTAAASFSHPDRLAANAARPQRRHTYVNLIDEFDYKLKHLGQW